MFYACLYLTRFTAETLKITIVPLVKTKSDKYEQDKPSSNNILLVAKNKKIKHVKKVVRVNLQVHWLSFPWKK